MIRELRLLALGLALALGGCIAGPCDGYAGTCVELTVTGPAVVLDRLTVTLSGAATGQGSTEAPSRAPFALPLITALHLPGAPSGELSIFVEGQREGATMGAGETRTAIEVGSKSSASVALQLRTPTDAAMDLPVPDLATDLADLRPPALQARIMFVTDSEGAGNLAGRTPDQFCMEQLNDDDLVAVLAGKTFKAFLARPTRDDLAAELEISATSTRKIVDVFGSAIMDERDLLDATAVPTPASSRGPTRTQKGEILNPATRSQCVWTGITTALGTGATCANWTAASSLEQGMTGTLDTPWWRGSSPSPCTNGCHVYCLEMP